jgi:hypothetical protein
VPASTRTDRRGLRERASARRGALAVTVAALLGLVVAGSPAAGASASGLKIALTARGNSLARLTGLRKFDFPGAYVGGYVSSRPTSLPCSTTTAGLTIDGWEKSTFATSEGQSVSSTVAVFDSAAMVTRDWARSVRSGTTACVGRLFSHAEKAVVVSAKRIAYRPTLEGQPLDYAALYHVLVRSGKTYHAASYYLLGEGHIEAVVTVTSIGRSTPPSIERLAAPLVISRFGG